MKYINENEKISYLNDEGIELGYLKYTEYSDEKLLSADSTFVDPSLRGQGVARKLVDELAEYAREINYKIRPVCSYVVRLFSEVDEYQDVAE